MEPQVQEKVVDFGKYQIGYELLTQTTLNLSIYNSESLQKYRGKNISLCSINCKGLIMSFRQSDSFRLSIKEVSVVQQQKQVKYIEMQVQISTPFIKGVKQLIQIPFFKKTSQTELLRLKIDQLTEKIKVINSKKLGLKIVKYIESNSFSSAIDPNAEYGYAGDLDGGDYQTKLFQKIQLPQNKKYVIQISFLLKAKATYFYFYIDKVSYRSPFPSGAMMAPTNSSFIPVKISYIVDNSVLKSNGHTFYCYDIVDYPFEVKNMVISAKKLQQ